MSDEGFPASSPMTRDVGGVRRKCTRVSGNNETLRKMSMLLKYLEDGFTDG